MTRMVDDQVMGGPLPVRDLVEIWQWLPEGKRLGFLHTLPEDIADQLMAATIKAADTQQRVAGTPAEQSR